MYTKIELIEFLQEYVKLYRRVPTQRAINKEPSLPSASTFVRHFGSWNEAIEQAGFEPATTKTESYTDEDLLFYIQDLAERIDRTPSDNDIRRDSFTPSPTTYRQRFGSLGEALKRAGLEPRPESCFYSDQELLDAICEAKEIFGWVPSSEEWQTKCGGFPAVSTYYRRFPDKSWEEIVRMSGAMDGGCPNNKEGD